MKKVNTKNSKKNKLRNFLKKFWWVVWKDDSFKGWILSLIFIFIVIKLIFFPFLNLVTGTSLPLAIVESCSMYHKGDLLGNFDEWYSRHDSKYEKFNINELDFKDFKMKKGFNKGDILFITKANPEKLELGDIIIFHGNQANPVIHRIVNIEEDNETNKKIFSTIGDNNNGQLNFEKHISEDQLVGKATLRLAPLIGWGKLIFFEGRKPQNERGFCTEN
jgi:signal peptidase I